MLTRSSLKQTSSPCEHYEGSVLWSIERIERLNRRLTRSRTHSCFGSCPSDGRALALRGTRGDADGWSERLRQATRMLGDDDFQVKRN